MICYRCGQPYQDGACGCDDGITLIHGDCRDVLPRFPSGLVDLVLTDPPYGIADKWQGGFSALHGWARAGEQKAERNSWDDAPPDAETLGHLMRVGRDAVIWGGNYFDLPPSRGWLVWNKPERGFTLAEAELAWTSRDTVIRVGDFPRSEPDRIHPTQKPLKLMSWCLSLFPNAATVLDAYAGSGTTLRAAKNLNRRAIGIENKEWWCERAARRLEQAVLPLEQPA